jgi:nicotinamide riboside kinase
MMANVRSHGILPSIYIVGAQCSGKTTLAIAIKEYFSSDPKLPLAALLTETARGVLRQHNFTRVDIRNKTSRCMDLQRLILEAQWTEELKVQDHLTLISDRSGIDPIVYAANYAQDRDTAVLLESTAWRELQNRMSRSLVIVCEPVEAWLEDDGIRLIPTDLAEWFAVHQSFCCHLEEASIPYCVLNASRTNILDRVQFVIGQWKDLANRVAREKGEPLWPISDDEEKRGAEFSGIGNTCQKRTDLDAD